jgi:hypothetical protein
MAWTSPCHIWHGLLSCISCLQEPGSAASALLEHTQQDQAKRSICRSQEAVPGISITKSITSYDRHQAESSMIAPAFLLVWMWQNESFVCLCMHKTAFVYYTSDLLALPRAGAATAGSCSLCQAGAYQTGSGKPCRDDQGAMSKLHICMAV